MAARDQIRSPGLTARAELEIRRLRQVRASLRDGYQSHGHGRIRVGRDSKREANPRGRRVAGGTPSPTQSPCGRLLRRLGRCQYQGDVKMNTTRIGQTRTPSRTRNFAPGVVIPSRSGRQAHTGIRDLRPLSGLKQQQLKQQRQPQSHQYRRRPPRPSLVCQITSPLNFPLQGLMLLHKRNGCSGPRAGISRHEPRAGSPL